MSGAPYRRHLASSEDLVTTYEATRAGFVQLALEKNRRATPFVHEARALQHSAARARAPKDLLAISDIEAGLLTAAGLSDKALTHLRPEDKKEAIRLLIENHLEPAGVKFVEELVFRFLLTRGDTLGGSMRNAGGVLAQRRLVRAFISTLRMAGTGYRWLHTKSRKWIEGSDNDSDIELSLRGLSWVRGNRSRTLLSNLTIPFVGNNVDLCLLDIGHGDLARDTYESASVYVAVGELKGGIDPAGADEHWKTARTALDRIRKSFRSESRVPATFFVGAAVEKKMATEIWRSLENGSLTNAANLNDDRQVASLSTWLCSL